MKKICFNCCSIFDKAVLHAKQLIFVRIKFWNAKMSWGMSFFPVSFSFFFVKSFAMTLWHHSALVYSCILSTELSVYRLFHTFWIILFCSTAWSLYLVKDSLKFRWSYNRVGKVSLQTIINFKSFPAILYFAEAPHVVLVKDSELAYDYFLKFWIFSNYVSNLF